MQESAPGAEAITRAGMPVVPAIHCHIERYLGPVNASWKETVDGQPCPFQVVRCAGGVIDTTFFCTVGLGDHPFPDLRGYANKLVRHELLIAVPGTFGTRNIPPLLQQLGTIALHRNRPFTRGEYMVGTSPLFGGLPFRGFYACRPCVVQDVGFAACTREDGKHVQFIWMVPLYEREIEFLRKHGPDRLEALFAHADADLVELSRGPVVN